MMFKRSAEAFEVIDFRLLRVAVDGAAEMVLEKRDWVNLRFVRVVASLLYPFLLPVFALGFKG